MFWSHFTRLEFSPRVEKIPRLDRVCLVGGYGAAWYVTSSYIYSCLLTPHSNYFIGGLGPFYAPRIFSTRGENSEGGPCSVGRWGGGRSGT